MARSASPAAMTEEEAFRPRCARSARPIRSNHHGNLVSNNPAARVGKLKGDILKHAMPAEVLGITGQQRAMPKNSGLTIVHRRYSPYGAANTDWNARNRPVADQTHPADRRGDAGHRSS